MTIKKFTGEAPFTAEFGDASPGRAANWLGLQIVCAYMDKNKEVALKQLMENNDYQSIFREAKYRP